MILKSCFMTVFVFFIPLVSSMPISNTQELADVAREEAERRRRLEEQGIEGKIIEANSATDSSKGNLTVSTMPPTKSETSHVRDNVSKKSSSIRSFQNALKKLDRTIRKEKERLETLRERLRKERWAPLKVGRASSGGQTEKEQNRLRTDIEELEFTLRELRRERSEVFDEGKKAGFLPGELDGKGIIP
jgi:ribosome-associated translation inhibitor RaiA